MLAVDLDAALGLGPVRLIGNLPYNISSPLLVRLIAVRDRVVDQHFMLQKEVVDRIVAAPATAAYGRLGAAAGVLRRRVAVRRAAGRVRTAAAGRFVGGAHAAACLQTRGGNLPYNISSPLLVHLLAHRERVDDQHFMLQREVVERIVAAPGSAEFGRLSVLMQAYYRGRRAGFVDAEVVQVDTVLGTLRPPSSSGRCAKVGFGPALALSITWWNSFMMSALYSEPIAPSCIAVKLLVMQPVFIRSPMRRNASTISGRITPLSSGSTWRPSTS